MTPTVKREILRARAEGLAWTAFRKIRARERAGAFFCGSLTRRPALVPRVDGVPPSKCRKISEYVSYSTVIAGRVVLCKHCLEGTTKKRD